MVNKGIFKLELVSATTNEAFQEHIGHNGKVYAEVEPDMDYFVKVSLDDPERNPIVFLVDVDDQPMDYYMLCEGGVERGEMLGDWKRDDGIDTFTALRFEKLKITHQNPEKGKGNPNEKVFGSVKVNFWELLRDQPPPGQESKDICWKPGNLDSITALMADTNIKDDKVLGSGIGNTKYSQKAARPPLACQRGKALGSIEVRYCTTVGLILAGILPKPPGWEWRHHAHYGKPHSNSTKKCLAVEPETVVLVHENAVLGQKEVSVDLYDLVDADESDSEEDDEGIASVSTDKN